MRRDVGLHGVANDTLRHCGLLDSCCCCCNRATSGEIRRHYSQTHRLTLLSARLLITQTRSTLTSRVSTVACGCLVSVVD